MIKFKKDINLKRKYNYFFFDFDGVLVNSIQNMEDAWNSTSRRFNLNIKFFEYRKYMGLAFFKILDKLKIKKNLYHKILKNYELHSTQNIHKIKLYKNVREVLKKIKKNKNNKIAIISSKNFYRIKKIIKIKKLKFDFISAPQKNLKGKPHPDQIIFTIKKMKILNIEKCLFIGDTENDYFASVSSKVDFVIANYGFGPINNIKLNKKINLYKINNFSEIKEFI
jgi:phosphoglycolate phosphatase